MLSFTMGIPSGVSASLAKVILESFDQKFSKDPGSESGMTSILVFTDF